MANKLPPIRKTDDGKWSTLNYQGDAYRIKVERGVPKQVGCVHDGQTHVADLQKRDGYFAADFDHASVYVRKGKDEQTDAPIFWLSFGRARTATAGIDEIGF